MSDWAKMSGWDTPGAQPRDVIRAAGYAVILASGLAALLPAANFDNGPLIVGGLMLIVGLLEVMANLLRAAGGKAAMAAGLTSAGAGLLMILGPVKSFVTTVFVLVGWLAVRGLLLALSSVEASGSTRRAALVAAVLDLILAGLLWTGLTASTLVIALFGPTQPIIADFAWVFAISFVAAGLLLVKVASEQTAA